MGAFADRYLFFLMPVFSALTVYFLYKMVRKFGRRLSSPCQVTIIALFLLAGIVQNQIIYPGHYLFLRDTETGEQTIESITKDADVIFVTPFDWHMVFYSTKLYDSHQFFAVLTESALDVTEQINDCPDFDPERPLYLIVEREKLRSEKFHRDKSLPDHILTFEESLTYDFSMTDVVNEISSSTVADKKEFLHSEKYFGGTLEIYSLR